jgi:pantothenate kinase
MSMTTESDRAATSILGAVRERRPGARLVAVVGVPGAGKSTVAAALADRVPGAVVVPMDGYHIPRSSLTADGLARRGAPDTFDPDALRSDLTRLRLLGGGEFPAFDHAAKDPAPGAVVVPSGTPLVVVEGLYLLLRAWRMADLFDFTVFLDCDLDTALGRVAARHMACGLVASPDEAWHRADTNDRRNALTVLDDGCSDRADLVIPSDGRRHFV